MFLYQNQISNLAFGCHTLIKSLKFRILNLGNFENFEIFPNHKNLNDIIMISCIYQELNQEANRGSDNGGNKIHFYLILWRFNF